MGAAARSASGQGVATAETLPLGAAARSATAGGLLIAQDGVALVTTAGRSATAQDVGLVESVPIGVAARAGNAGILDLSYRLDLGSANRSATAQALGTVAQGVVALSPATRVAAASGVSVVPTAFFLETATRSAVAGNIFPLSAFTGGDVDGVPETTHLGSLWYSRLDEIDPDERKAASHGRRGILSG